MIKAELTSKKFLASHLGIFTYKPEKKIEFLPGQYLTLGVRRKGLEGPGVRIADGYGTVFRPYSVVSAPHEEELELIIAWVQREGRRSDAWGVLTTEIFDPQPGQEYLFRPKPKGKFLLPDDSRDVIMLATGTGIAPYISILRSLASRKVTRKFLLIHGVSRQADLGYRDELSGYRSPPVTYLRTISRDECRECENRYIEEYFLNRSGRTGRVSREEVDEAIETGNITGTGIEKILGGELTPETSVIMLCGNPAMIEHVKKICEAKNFKLHRDIIVESYW